MIYPNETPAFSEAICNSINADKDLKPGDKVTVLAWMKDRVQVFISGQKRWVKASNFNPVKP
jgi:hypothetical protein